ncbi:restriction endonuclease [Aeromonas caviae]
MTALVHFEYPPPKSWEQFEELCADLFEAMWSDPALVRHGRAGQTQNGVDIVAARGGIFPVGLQCKKKSQWPIKNLNIAEVIYEIKEADKFTPMLEEFYILTTATSDAELQKKVWELNISRKNEGKFLVEVLFWPEIIRRVARFDHIARKHFPLGANKNEFSPLLATWYTRNGQIELSNTEWSLAVGEVGEDFYEWPTGHVVIRQRETDELIEELKKMERALTTTEARNAKIKLRRKLRYMNEIEIHLQDMIRMIFITERLKFYIYDLDENGADAPEILQSIIESELSPIINTFNLNKIRLYPPTPELLFGPCSSSSVTDCNLPINMPDDEYEKILEAEAAFPIKYYGNEMVKVVSELPNSVKRRFVIPAIIRRINRIMKEDRKTIEEMDIAGYLDLYQWKYKH